MGLYQSIKEIANSIKDRGSKQGEKVFAAALEQLPELDSNNERADFLKRLNRALTGMEAHGEFTDEEYQIVRFLRDKEQVLDKVEELLENNQKLLQDTEVKEYQIFKSRILE